jgi:hypothetical protein
VFWLDASAAATVTVADGRLTASLHRTSHPSTELDREIQPKADLADVAAMKLVELKQECALS